MTFNEDINYKAQKARESFGEDSNSPIDIFSLLAYQENYTIVFFPMNHDISGLCIKGDNYNLIGINSTDTLARQRFTAAHELCHILYHEGNNCYICQKPAKDKNEKEADKFACYLLAPQYSFRRFAERVIGKDKVTLKHILKIEQYFGLSRNTTLWRLINEGYEINKEQFEANVIKNALLNGYGKELYVAPIDKNGQYIKKTIGQYIRLANELKEQDIISLGKYNELLNEAFCENVLQSEGEIEYNEPDIF